MAISLLYRWDQAFGSIVHKVVWGEGEEREPAGLTSRGFARIAVRSRQKEDRAPHEIISRIAKEERKIT